MSEKIIIVEFGNNARLIAKKVRKFNWKTKIIVPPVSFKEIKSAAGVILSGSPFDTRHLTPTILDSKILGLGTPILGICYGAQVVTVLSGGKVETKEDMAEYGKFEMEIVKRSRLFEGLSDKEEVWMRHADSITKVPPNFIITAQTKKCIAAIEHFERPIFAIQFHPEYARTKCGNKILKNFLDICRNKEHLIPKTR